MIFPDLLEWIGLGILCLSAALAASVWIDGGPWSKSVRRIANLPEQANAVFLFDGSQLVDASTPARALLEEAEGSGTEADPDLTQVCQSLALRFRDVPEGGLEACSDATPKPGIDSGIDDSGVFAARDPMDAHELCVERLDGMLRLEVRPVQLPGLVKARDARALHALEGEYDTLRSTMEMAPYPIWRVNDDGAVDWHNGAYADLFQRTHGKRPGPGQRLFQSALDSKPSGSRIRASISVPGEDNFFWFDVWITRHDGFRMFYAVDVGAVVNAEIAQRNFVQTLAKTFAQLSIGLAIFDRNRQLVLFNPALIDLTALPADFLSARPNLLSFFDRLRDARVMPEPKNYANWRDQIADLVAAAADGRYQETWSLPSGSIYQVSGRPHPDGAVAFLFEDITAEVTLTRRFKAELEISQSILDKLDEAVAVFGANGVLSLSNAAYRRLWQVDPDASFAEVTVMDATRDWADRSNPTPIWGDIRDFVGGAPDRTNWWADVTLTSGVLVVCSVHPIQDGGTMVTFRTGVAESGQSLGRHLPADAS